MPGIKVDVGRTYTVSGQADLSKCNVPVSFGIKVRTGWVDNFEPAFGTIHILDESSIYTLSGDPAVAKTVPIPAGNINIKMGELLLGYPLILPYIQGLVVNAKSVRSGKVYAHPPGPLLDLEVAGEQVVITIDWALT